MKALAAAALLAGALIAWWVGALAPARQVREGEVEITMMRFFGGCTDEYGAETDLRRATGECGLIQTLTNRFNAENAGRIRVRTQTAQWSSYYDRLGTSFAAKHPPDVAVMHRSMLPEYASRGLLAAVGEPLAAAGVNWDDLLPAARAAATIRGRIYGVPFDLHTLLWHINLDLFARAGLLDADGRPILPRAPEELLDHARRMKQATGVRYFAIPSRTDPMPSWNFEQWIWQQRSDVISDDLAAPTLQTPAAERALELMTALYRGGHASARDDYSGAEETFLQGRSAVLLNGTWAVDDYLAATRKAGSGLKRYFASSAPTLFEVDSAWSDSHVWVVPDAEARDPRALEASLLFLRYLFEHGGAWARTGNLPVRRSVLEGAEFLALPERAHYAATALRARAFRPVQRQRAIQDALVQEISATWLNQRPPKESLAKAQEVVGEIFGWDRR